MGIGVACTGPDAISRDAAVTACAATFLWAEALSLIDAAPGGAGYDHRGFNVFKTMGFEGPLSTIQGNIINKTDIKQLISST
jgi:hypothetical protein